LGILVDALKKFDQSRFCLLACWALLLGLSWNASVQAHVGGHSSSGGGMQSGFLHPISGLDHALAMLAVGLWGAQLGLPALWVLPIAFPLVMALGGAMSLIGIPLPAVEVGIAGSGVVLGLMVLLEVRPPLAVSLLLVGVFALFHGHAHVTELPAGESGLWYSLGFVVSTGLLHAAGIGLGSIHRWEWGKVCLRGAGAVVLAGGIYFLSGSLGWFA
jgi:urease accessory protein